MSYEKQAWQNGDVITDEKMNHIENGIDEVDSDVSALNSKVNGMITVSGEKLVVTTSSNS